MSQFSEVAWLIEQEYGSGPGWWNGADAWTASANRAVRFARKQDAERVIARDPNLVLFGAKATEHMWEKKPDGPEHICGARGFGLAHGDVCPACEADRAKRESAPSRPEEPT